MKNTRVIIRGRPVNRHFLAVLQPPLAPIILQPVKLRRSSSCSVGPCFFGSEIIPLCHWCTHPIVSRSSRYPFLFSVFLFKVPISEIAYTVKSHFQPLVRPHLPSPQGRKGSLHHDLVQSKHLPAAPSQIQNPPAFHRRMAIWTPSMERLVRSTCFVSGIEFFLAPCYKTAEFCQSTMACQQWRPSTWRGSDGLGSACKRTAFASKLEPSLEEVPCCHWDCKRKSEGVKNQAGIGFHV